MASELKQDKLYKFTREKHESSYTHKPAAPSEISAACPVCAARKAVTSREILSFIFDIAEMVDVCQPDEVIVAHFREWLDKLGR